jgi:hypothetical protein
MLVDAAFGLALLAATGLLLAGLLAGLAHLRRASDVRQAALQTAANLMERLAAEPWEQLQPGRRELALPAELASVLPGATASAQIGDADEPGLTELRKIEVELRWPASSAAPRPIRLVTWLGHTRRPLP